MPSKANPIRPRDRSLAFREPAIQAFLREIKAPGTGKTQHREIVSPSTCEVLGSRVTAKSPAWAGLKFDRAVARTKCPMTGVPRPHLGVPWVHPEDEANGMEADAIYRVDPIWSVGDHIWIREAFATGRPDHLWGPTVYRATHTAMAPVCEGFTPWRSATQMPRDRSRLTLLVTEVRVERLAEIADQDALKEGASAVDLPTHGPKEATGRPPLGQSPRARFRHLWDAQRGPGAFDANPWVIVSTLRPILSNIDALAGEADLGRGGGGVGSDQTMPERSGALTVER